LAAAVEFARSAQRDQIVVGSVQTEWWRAQSGENLPPLAAIIQFDILSLAQGPAGGIYGALKWSDQKLIAKQMSSATMARGIRLGGVENGR
jgi:hypothetical protein